MEYREIVSVTGIGGLFQLLTTKSDGAIVRNISDNSTKFISARLHNVTPLESIEVYTTGDNVRLHEVFQKMKDAEATHPVPDNPKSADNNTIKAYFDAVYPDFDQDRVYVSDMKKMLKWYLLLKEKDLLNFEYQQEEETAGATEEADVAETEVQEEQPAAKKAAKKKAVKEEEGADSEEKPAKKAAPKKKATKKAGGAEETPAKKTAKRKSE